MNSAAQRVLNTAARYVGVHEEPDGSNRGPLIDRWQRAWGMLGEPWCGIFASAVYREAGVTDVAHPATWTICTRGRAMGWVSDKPVPGGLIVWCGTHVGILVEPVAPGVWRTIEGNTSNRVAYRTRSLEGTTIVVPPELRGQTEMPAARRYYLEDPAAVQRFYGPWRAKANRERAIAKLTPANRARARRVRTAKGYGFTLGPTRVYGPWSTTTARASAQALLEKRLGRRLRPFSRPAPAAQAESLGQTT